MLSISKNKTKNMNEPFFYYSILQIQSTEKLKEISRSTLWQGTYFKEKSILNQDFTGSLKFVEK